MPSSSGTCRSCAASRAATPGGASHRTSSRSARSGRFWRSSGSTRAARSSSPRTPCRPSSARSSGISAIAPGRSTPRRMKELSVRLSRVIQTRTAEPRAPTIAELAEATGADEDEVVEALQTSEAYSTRSLSQPLGGGPDDDTMQDVLGSNDDGFGDVENSVFVEAGLSALDERERRIVELRFFDGLTQSEIAARIGISQMHVSRLLRRALYTMRGSRRRSGRDARNRHAHDPREDGVPRRGAARARRYRACRDDGRVGLADLKLAVTEAATRCGTRTPRPTASCRSASPRRGRDRDHRRGRGSRPGARRATRHATSGRARRRTARGRPGPCAHRRSWTTWRFATARWGTARWC